MAIKLAARGLRSTSPPPSVLAWVAIIAAALAACAGAIMLSGTKTGTALALLAVLGPLAAYAAFTKPLIFPLTIFILLVPFDNLLAVSSFGTATKAVAEASGGAIAFWLLRTRNFVTPDKALLWWLAFFLYALTSLTWAIDPAYATAHVMTTLQLLSLYVAISFMPVDRRTFTTIVTTVIVSGSIAGLYGAYLFHRGIDVTTGGRLILASDNNVIDPNQFAASLVLPFALTLSTIVQARGAAARCLPGLAILCIAGGIAVSSSRGAVIAIGVCFFYMVWKSRRRIALIALGFGGVAVALSLFNKVLERFTIATSTGGAGRADIWKVGFAAFTSHPIFGQGFSNFPLAYDRSFLSVSETYYTRWHRGPHDILVEIGVELGTVGIALLVAAWWQQARALRIIPPDGRLYPLRIAIEGALIGLFISALFLDELYMKYLWLAFIIAMLARNAERTHIDRSRGRVSS